MANRSTPSKAFTPTKGKAVNYYRHFPTNFLSPYGETRGVPDKDDIFKRLKPFNCEWLSRPRTALSEMADTIVSNVKHVEKDCPPFMNKDAITEIRESMEPLIEVLDRLNTKNQAVQARPKDIKAMLRTIYNGDHDATFEQFLVAGSAMYTMGIHYVVAKTLMESPEGYAKILSTGNENSPGEKAFRASPDGRTLKAMLVETLQSDTPVAKNDSDDSKRKLLRSLLSDDDSIESAEEEPLHSPDEEEALPTKKKGKRKHKKRKGSEEADS